MKSLNKEIILLKNKIEILESKLQALTKNLQGKKPAPYSKVATRQGQGWWLIDGKWCTYAIYAD